MPKEKRDALTTRWKHLSTQSRIRASERQREMKEERIAALKSRVDIEYVSILESTNSQMLEIALAMLYLGEGTKSKKLALGNSDPKIILFYVQSLEKLYGIPRNSLRADLHLRFDQDEEELKSFWSQVTAIPVENFSYTVRDKRTQGKPTYPGYNGVCYIDGGGVEIQRRLVYLAEVFCSRNMGD